MKVSATQKNNRVIRWSAWAATFVSFIAGGVAARAIAGPVVDLPSALFAGLIAGAIIGLAQWLVLRALAPAFTDARWAVATAVGFSLGLAAGSTLVDYRTGAVDLAVMGFVTGLGVGALQAWALKDRIGASWRWVLLSAPLWAASWLVTWAIGVDVSLRWAVFGASGALFNTLIAGAALYWLMHEHAQVGNGASESRVTGETVNRGAVN